MKREQRYGIRSLEKDFPNDETCLNFIFDTLHTPQCSCGGTYKILHGRRQYQCSKCRFQIAPTAGTIFHKSDTPLSLWFKAILMFSNSKSGISAKYLERELEVTYKCAYRILKQIRKALPQDDNKLRGDVEIDTGYFGGKGNAGKDNKNLSDVMAKKSVVTIAVERGGNIRAEVLPDNSAQTMQSFIDRNIETKATSIMTNSSRVYARSAKTHDKVSVDHHKGEFVRGDVHINTVETFFSHLKRSIKGTYKSISRQQLQSYLDAFVFHYNNRHSDKARFGALLGNVIHA
jgi:transposase